MSPIFELEQRECEQLLHAGAFGRLVLVNGPRGVEILPVNYVSVGNVILIQTAGGSLLDRYGDGSPMLFEVDDVDYERAHGWSVVARGHGEIVAEEDLTDLERRVPGPPRWVHRDDRRWVRLRWDELSGRRIGVAWDCLSEMPVRRMWP